MFYGCSRVEHAGELVGSKGRSSCLGNGLDERDIVGATLCVWGFIEKDAIDGDVGRGIRVPGGPLGHVLSDAVLVGSVRAVDVAECLDVRVRVQLGGAGDEIAIRLRCAWARIYIQNNLEFGLGVCLNGGVNRIPSGTLRVLVKRKQKLGSERRSREKKKE